MHFAPARTGCLFLLYATCLSRSLFAQTSSVIDPVRTELAAMGPRGLLVTVARDDVLEILQSDNRCSAWFRAADPDAAATFSSLRFAIDSRGPQYILGWRAASGDNLLKHPYAARAPENTGRDSTITLNANGAFFARSTSVLWRANSSNFLFPLRSGILQVGSYAGNTLSAQITTLLHEFGHVVGRIPSDSDELSGQSDRNTAEVLRHCRVQIKAVTRRSHNP